MEHKYYDRWEFKQALDLIEINPLESKRLFEIYLQKYPEDYSAYTYYCSALVCLGEFEEAKKVFDYVEKIFIKYKKFREPQKMKFFEQNILYNKIKLLIYEKRYEELYEVLNSCPKDFITDLFYGVFFYCKKQLGLLDPNRREPNSYLFKQIVRYEEKDFLEHIKKHLADYNMLEDKRNSSIFVPDFPIYEVIEEIKKYIPSNSRTYPGFLENVYTFKYDGCGREDNRLVDYFKVICFHDTQEFITICPVAAPKCENLPYIDLNYLVNNKENVKVKQLSQIEKFNKKFGRK